MDESTSPPIRTPSSEQDDSRNGTTQPNPSPMIFEDGEIQNLGESSSPSVWRSPSPEKLNALGLSTEPTDLPKLQTAFSNKSPVMRSATGTPKRVSFDSPRPGDTVYARDALNLQPPENNDSHTAIQQNPSRFRSLSPRRLWPIHRSRSREDPFIPVNPYQFPQWTGTGRPSSERRREACMMWLGVGIRQFFLAMHFRLPAAYFARVGRVFEYAELSKPEVQRMIELGGSAFLRERDWSPNNVPPSLARYKEAWEELIDSMLREWKTLNVVSALLLSAILTIFQTDGATEPVTRTTALISLVCALWSLVMGCTYILRFSTMRSIKRGCQWAEAAQETTTSVTWNVWIFLALPAVFLIWSLIMFVTAILAFVWTTGTSSLPAPISEKYAVGPRAGITVVFCIGLIYFALVISTLRSYSLPQDKRHPLDAPSSSRAREWMSSPRLHNVMTDLERGLDREGGDLKEEAIELASNAGSSPKRGRPPR